MSAFMAQRGAARRAATPARRSAIRCTRRGCTCAARSPGSAPTASRRRCAISTAPRWASCSPGRDRRSRSRRVPPLRLGAAALQLPHRQRGGVLMTAGNGAAAAPGFTPGCASRRRSTARRSPRSSAPPARGSTIRGFGAKRRVPHFDDLLFLGATVSRYPLEGYRERCATDVVIGTRFAREPIELEIPITIAGMSFGALAGPPRRRSAAARRRSAPRRRPATAG